MTPGERHLRIPVGALLWTVVLVLWLTWSPFLPRETPATVSVTPFTSVGDWVINLLLLVPVGIVSGLGVPREGGWRRWLPAVLAVVAVALLAEGGQFRVAGRQVAVFDTVLNVTGGIGGIAACLHARRLGYGRRVILAVVGSHLFFGVVVYLTALSAQVGGAHRLDDWRPEFGIRVGGEFEAPREYRGTITDARICAGRGREEVCAAGGASVERRTRLSRLATRSQRVELRARVRPATGDQFGPTRIITFSENEALRNATLGQSGRSLVLRLRTPLAGENGSRVEFELPGALPAGQTVRAMGRYDRGRVLLSVEGGEEGHRLVRDYRLLTIARVVAWSVDDYRPHQLAMAAAVGLLAFFLPIGLGYGWLLGTRPVAATVAAVLTAAAAFTVLSNLLQVGWVPSWFALAACTAGIGVLAGRADRAYIGGSA